MKHKKAISFILTIALIFTMTAGFTTVGFVETAENVHATETWETITGTAFDFSFDGGRLSVSGSGIMNISSFCRIEDYL